MAIQWTGAQDYAYNGGGLRAIDVALPAGAEIGNTLIVLGNFTSVLGDASFTLTDSRVSKVLNLNTPYGVGSLWVGTVEDLSNVTGSGYEPGGSNGGVVLVATLRNKVDPAKLATVTSTGSNDFTIPALSGVTSGALVASVARHGVGGMTWVTGVDYTDVKVGGTYAQAALSYTEVRPDVSAQAASWDWTSGESDSHTAVIGIGPLVLVAPPCRLFPREDGLGVGGGRHFPPPKSQQRSGRRFGYY